MGRGNFCPSGILTDQWYIDNSIYRYDNGEEEYEYDWWQNDHDIDEIMHRIKERFPSFNIKVKTIDGYWGQQVQLENEWFQIGVADNEWSTAIWISERRDFDEAMLALAMKHFDTYRHAIRRLLLEYFEEIHLRNGAWMSISWTMEKEKMTGYKPKEKEAV